MSKIYTLLLVLLVIFFHQSFSQNGKKIDQVIGVVGDQIVLQSELESQIANYISQGTIIDNNQKCVMFEDLLFQKLLLNQAEIDSVIATEEQVDQEIDRRLDYFISQIGSEKQLEAYYKKSIVEIKEEFKPVVKNQITAQLMQQQISSNVKVTPKEVTAYFNGLEKDSIPMIDAQVEMQQIVINAKESKTSIEEAMSRILSLKERVENGEDFSTLAILYSEDPGSSKNGGELGFLGRAELVPEFSAVAFKLKNNKVSDVVKTKFGYHIIQLVERRGEKVNVRHILIKPKVDEKQILKAKEKADSVYNLIMIDSLTFEKAALLYSDDEKTAKSNGLIVNPNSGTSTFNMAEVESNLYYVVKNMKQNEISKPIPYQNYDGTQGYRFVKLLKKTEAHKADLNNDYDKIQDAALISKQNKATLKWIKSKISVTYIKIHEDYQNCSFENSWIKK